MSYGSNTSPVRGFGLDLVHVKTVRLAIQRDVDAIYGWLAESEVESLADRVTSAETLAGRVAAKEAVVKSLGCGFNNEVAWQDVTILVDENGAPTVRLTGGAAAVAEQIGVRHVLVTITHAGDYAAALACALA